VKRGPRPVDPVEEVVPAEDEEAAATVDDELEIEPGTEAEEVVPVEEPDETGEDSYD
jgi:hypothetical protein